MLLPIVRYSRISALKGFVMLSIKNIHKNESSSVRKNNRIPLIVILLSLLVVGAILLWIIKAEAQCVPNDLTCMNIE